MASEGLAWSLANGITEAQYYENLRNSLTNATQSGMSDAAIAQEMEKYGISAADLAKATGVATEVVQARIDAVTTPGLLEPDVVTPTTPTGGGGLLTPDVVTPVPPVTQPVTQPVVAPPVLETPATPAQSAGLAWSLANGISQEQYDKNLVNAYKDAVAKGLTDAQIESGMNQYGISAADLARATGVTPESVQARLDAATPTTAAEIAYNKAAMDELAVREAQNQQQIGTNQKAYEEQQRLNNLASAEQQRLNQLASQQQIATNQKAYEGYLANQAKLAGPSQGFAQNLANYQAIAPGAQFDPSVTGGASPYGLIMGQMKPFSNPYANIPANRPLAGYNPGLYDQIAAANLARDVAAKSGVTLADYYGGGGDANSADAGEGPGGNSGGGEGNGATAGEAGAGYAMGGMVNGLFGMNPPGPDDGAGYLDRGEYVIRKSSVNKYGRGLLDMINEGKVPAKKIKSLLG